jgi:hypothetical protein
VSYADKSSLSNKPHQRLVKSPNVYWSVHKGLCYNAQFKLKALFIEKAMKYLLENDHDAPLQMIQTGLTIFRII